MKRFSTAVLALVLVCFLVGLGSVTTCLAKAKYDTIRIASFEPRSGTFKMIGDAKTYGVQYNTRLWNEQHGGLLGKKIEVIPYDNQLKPDVAVRLATKAILEEKCNVLFSSTGSHIAKALQGVAEKYKVLFIMGVAEAASLTGEHCNPYSFRIALNTAMHSRAVAHYFADKPEIKTFGIICQDYNFGYEAAEDFKKALKEFRPDAKIAVEIYHPIATKDFAPYITKLNASGAQWVFTGNWGSDLLLLMKQGKGLGLKAKLAGYYFEDPFVLKDVQEAAIGHIWADGTTAWYPSEKQKAYNEGWGKHWKEYAGEDADPLWRVPWTSVMQSYNLHMLFKAIEKTGEWDVEKIVKNFEGMEFDGLYGTVVMRAEDHQLQMPIPIMECVKENALFNEEFPGGKLLKMTTLEEASIPLEKTGCTRKAGEF